MNCEPCTKICPREYSAPPARSLQQPVLLAMNCVLLIAPPCVHTPPPSLGPVLLMNWLPVMKTFVAMTAPPLMNALF